MNSVGVNIQIIPSLSILGSKQQIFRSELGAGMGKDEQSATRTTLKRCCKRSPTVDLNFILADRNFRFFFFFFFFFFCHNRCGGTAMMTLRAMTVKRKHAISQMRNFMFSFRYHIVKQSSRDYQYSNRHC